MSVSAVIAAAGLSSRMRDFKPLLCLGTSTVIHHTIDTLRAAGAEDILVVTGYQSAVLERHLNFSGVMFLQIRRDACGLGEAECELCNQHRGWLPFRP